MCVRRAAGYCCIQYQVCADQTNAFSLDGGTAISAIDTACTLDYIAIPGETSPFGSMRIDSLIISYKVCIFYLIVVSTEVNIPVNTAFGISVLITDLLPMTRERMIYLT